MPRREQAPLITDAIPGALRRRGITPRRMFATCLIGALALALFASRDLPGWAERLGDAPLAHYARSLAGDWDRAMEDFGLVHPHEALRAAMGRFLDWQWHGDNR
jgi:hypothetical protein